MAFLKSKKKAAEAPEDEEFLKKDEQSEVTPVKETVPARRQTTQPPAKKSTEFDLSDLGEGIFDLKENMEGVEARLPAIDIAHQVQMFILPGGEKPDFFDGVILDVHRANAYWSKPMSEGSTEPPDCASLDGVKPADYIDSPQNNNCIDCPMNQWESDPKGGDGKACKNMKRVHVMLEGNQMPMRLNIPPTSMKAMDEYITLLTSRAIPYQLVITRFRLRSVESKGGIEYSELLLEMVGKAVENREEALEIKKLREQWMSTMRGDPLLNTNTGAAD